MSNAPVMMDKAVMAGEGLAEIPQWPAEILKSGCETHKVAPLFGGEFVVLVYEGEDGVLEFNDYPFDEYCYVIQGSSILTPEGGEPQTFNVGDHFVVPKGFTGTWELKDNFRELIIMESAANEVGMKKLGLA